MRKNLKYCILSIFLVCLIISLINCKYKKSRQSAIKTESLNKYQKDFQIIENSLRKIHPGVVPEPLPFMKKSDFDRLILSTYQTLEKINNRTDFYIELLKFCTKINDGHTKIMGIAPNGNWLPIAVSWFNGSLYITDIEDKKYKNLQYKKIIKFNDIPINEFETRINQFISADKNNIYRKRIFSPNFITQKIYLKYLNLLDTENRIKITYLNDTDESEIFIPVNELFQVNSTDIGRNDITKVIKKSNFHTLLKEKSVIYVQFNDMRKKVDKDFWKEVFTIISNNKIKYLVLDLRNNSGGKSRWNDALLPYLVKKVQPINVYSGWQRNGDENKNIITGIKRVKPVKNKNLRFKGSLFVITGPGTFSSATFIAVSVKDNSLGTIIGAPCGNISIRYGNSNWYKLPSSGFRFMTSNRIWGRALYRDNISEITNEKNDFFFIMPDIMVNTTIEDYINKRDPVWEYLEKNIFNN